VAASSAVAASLAAGVMAAPGLPGEIAPRPGAEPLLGGAPADAMLAAGIAEAALPDADRLAAGEGAVAAFAAGGAILPGAGKDPPVCAPSWALPAAWRRVDFAPTLLSVAAKS
jgi:hypothetical protein